VHAREICCGPSEEIDVLSEDVFDVVYFIFRDGGAYLEELVLLL